MLAYGLPFWRRPDWFIPHIGDPHAAITRSGATWPRQPNTSIGRQWPISMRDPPEAGNTGLTIEPSGALTAIGRQAPSLFGSSGAVHTLMPYMVIANV